MLRFSYIHTYQNLDRGLIEFFGPQGLTIEIYRLLRKIDSLSIGFVFRIFFINVCGFVLIIAILY